MADEFSGLGHKVASVCLENLRQVIHFAFLRFEVVIGPHPGLALDAPNAGGHAGLRDNLEEAELTCMPAVGAATELAAEGIHLNHPNPVPILVTEEGQRAC